MSICLQSMNFRDDELGLKADVTSTCYFDGVAEFVRFCIVSEEVFKDTKVYLIRFNVSTRKSEVEIAKFLSSLKEYLKDDNNVVFILKTNRNDIDLSNIGFLHYCFDEYLLQFDSGLISDDVHEYYICDHAKIDVHILVSGMQEKLDRTGYQIAFIRPNK